MGKLKKRGRDVDRVRKVRKRTLLRWVAPGLSTVALTVSLATVVRRDEDGRGLSSEFQALGEEAQIISDHIVVEHTRVDSLTDLARIEAVATAIGLRRALDDELVRVEESTDFDGTDKGVLEVKRQR